MSAEWVEAIGSWAGTIATVATAIVAVGIALQGSFREMARHIEETTAREQAVVNGLLHAHRLMEMAYAGNAANPQADIAVKGLRVAIDSALAAVRYALSQPFVNAQLLGHALNLQTVLAMVAADIATLPPHAPYLAVADAKKMLEPFENDMAKGKAMLEALAVMVPANGAFVNFRHDPPNLEPSPPSSST